MSKAFDDLEKQLRRAVRARRPRSSSWVRHGRRQTWVIVAAALLVISAGAFAAARIAHGQSAETQGRELALQAVRDTEHLAPCQRLESISRGLTFAEAPVLSAITHLLPLLRKPPSASERERALAMLPRLGPTGNAVLSQTLHLVTLQEGIRVLAFVEAGLGFLAVHDAAACARTRQARAAELAANRPNAVRWWARRSLAKMPDTVPGVQTLEIFANDPRQRGGGGGAQPIAPGQRLEPGLRQVAGQRDGSRLFVGIAGARASAVRIQTTQITAMHGLPTQVPVRERFYAIKIPRGLRPFRLLEVGTTGTVMRSINLRQ